MSTPMRGYTIGPGFIREEARPHGPNSWKIRPYGVLEGVELFLAEPIPNMDAAAHIEVRAELIVNGHHYSFDRLFARCRSVELNR